MNFKGELRKMLVDFNSENVVQYEMLFFNTETQEKESLSMNELIDKSISFEYTGNIYCKNCGTQTKSTFNQRFCYHCSKDNAESAECIIRPELCLAHLGQGRYVEWQ